jgi:putative copper resistance protein D
MSDDMFAGLVISRFVHYLALSVLFGAALFPFYAFGGSQTEAFRRVRWLRMLLFGAALVTFGSGISWLVFANSPNVFSAIHGMDFGMVWLFRLLLSAALIPLVVWKTGAAWQIRTVLFTALVLLASIALTGNAGSNDGSLGLQHRLADAVHLVASGAWIGALVVFSGLAMAAARHRDHDDLLTLHTVLSRFSGVGSAVVAALTLSGMFNPGFFLSRLDTAYGQVLLAKLVIFGMMLMLAAANRFWLTPRLAAILAGTRHTAHNLKTAIWALQASILFETLLAFLVLATVAVLGAVAPPDFQ